MKAPFRSLRPFAVMCCTLLFLFSFTLLERKFALHHPFIKPLHFFAGLEYEKAAPQTTVASTSHTDKGGTTVRIVTPNPINEPLFISDFGATGEHGMQHFFEALKNHRTKKKIRIAWFGDSMVEGDLITQDLRELMQKKYGGKGVGIVPVTSATAGFRQSVKHTFSEDWKQKSLLDHTDPELPIGITGFGFKPDIKTTDDTTYLLQKNESSWVMLRAGKMSSRLSEFDKIRLFYGPADAHNFCTVRIDDLEPFNLTLHGHNAVNVAEIKTGAPFKNALLNFGGTAAPGIFALSAESDTGIFVDNLSFRGNSGMPLTKIPQSVCRGFNEANAYDLIILQYGMNAVSSTTIDYSWYERGLVRMVEHIKACFPQSSIMFVSVGDKGMKQNGEFVTDPGVLRVLETERKVAEQTGIAFWNLYEAMGGYNAMVRWAQADTALANKDYTHLNFRGAARVGRMLHDQLHKDFSTYCKKEKNSGSTVHLN